jgi:hypothetical protein
MSMMCFPWIMHSLKTCMHLCAQICLNPSHLAFFHEKNPRVAFLNVRKLCVFNIPLTVCPCALQSRVHSIIKQKHDSYLEERAESARIAACYPLTFAPEPQHPGARESSPERINKMAMTSHATTSDVLSGSASILQCEGRNFAAMCEEDMFAKKKSASDRSPPAPLTEALLATALTELSSGASLSIRTCLDCWRGKRLTDSDLLSTVRSFAGSSPSLSKAFAASAPKEDTESCVASLEDMLALAQLSRSAVAESGR